MVLVGMQLDMFSCVLTEKPQIGQLNEAFSALLILNRS
jgi:hypothetical protein